MNLPILTANILTFLTLIGHTFIGDRDLKTIEPENIDSKFYSKLEQWVHARAHHYMVSMDFLLATIGLILINFTDFFQDKSLILQILSIYFLAYSIGFLVSIIVSKQFPKNYLKLGHWILLIIISGLIYLGAN
jgi:hypothetical protein